MTSPLPPFPSELPQGYQRLDAEPRFDPRRHLALEAPERVWTLAEFGYGSDVTESTPSPVAAAGPFRVLSQEGTAALLQVCRSLRGARQVFDDELRTSSFVPGAVYRSAFLRDLCNSSEIAAFLSDLAGTSLAPHSMPSQQLYVNFAPDRPEQAIDNWHVDSIGFDYVLMASDPAVLAGGKFQIFRGTQEHAAELLRTTVDHLVNGFLDELPQELIETVTFPRCGLRLLTAGSSGVSPRDPDGQTG